MNKTRLLSIGIIILLVINIASLSFLWFGRMHRPPFPPAPNGGAQGPKMIIIQRLNLDATQQADYEDLIREHQEKLADLDQQIRETKNQLYSSLAQEDSTELKDLEKRLGDLQTEVEQTHVQHFLAIKKLCRPDQLKDYNFLVKDLARLFAPQNQPRPPKPEDHP